MSGSVDTLTAEIKADYLNEANRVPMPDEINSWVSALQNGTPESSLRFDLAYDGEAFKALNTLYAGLTWRYVTVDESVTICGQLAAGTTTLEIVRTQLAGLDETTNLLRNIFHDATGVEADTSWLQSMQQNLATTWTLTDVVSSVVALCAGIQGLYLGILGRHADAGGLAGDLEAYAAGISLEDIRRGIADSSEAAAVVTQLCVNAGVFPTAATVRALQANLGGQGTVFWTLSDVSTWLSSNIRSIDGFYEDVLGRSADEIGVAGDLDAIAQGGTLNQIRSDLSKSGEAYNEIMIDYQSELGRDARADEEEYFQQQLGQGGATAVSLRTGLAQSDGAINALGAIYQQLLNRPVKGTDLTWAENELISGKSLNDIRNEIAVSTEEYNDVQAIFQQVWGRAAGDAEVTLVVGWVLQGILPSLQGLRTWFANGATIQIDSIYEQVLNRPAGVDGNAYGVAILSGGGSLATLRNALVNSAEAQTKIGYIYGDVLGRGASDQDVNNGQIILLNGGTQADIRTWLARSQEAQSDIDGLYRQVLGRPVDGTGVASCQNILISGGTMADLRGKIATSTEAAALVRALFTNIWGRDAGTEEVSNVQRSLVAGENLQDLRNWFATVTGGSQPPIDTIYQQVLGRGPSAAELTNAQTVLANGGSLNGLMQWLTVNQAQLADSASDVLTLRLSEDAWQGDAQFTVSVDGVQQGGVQTVTSLQGRGQSQDVTVTASGLATGSHIVTVNFLNDAYGGSASTDRNLYVLGATLNGVALPGSQLYEFSGGPQSFSYAGTLEMSATYQGADAIYQDVLGREMGAADWGFVQSVLGAGGTLATVRADVAQSQEAAGIIQSFYEITFGRAASADEVTGMQFAEGLTITDDDQFGYYKADGTVLAVTSSSNLLAQLPVAVTLYNGVTPILGLPGGAGKLFANATQLAACILGFDLRQNQAVVGSLSAYQVTVKWLDEIDQPMLQVAANLASVAAYDKSIGNDAQVTLASTAYSLALKIAAMPPEARGGPNWGLSASVMVNGHKTDVIVYNDTSTPNGHIIYHDKAPDIISSLIEEVVTIVVDVLAVFPPTAAIFAPIAVVLNTAEAGQSFAEGNVLGGVLHIASAFGFGYVAYGADGFASAGLTGEAAANATKAAITSGTTILAATAILGGTSSIVQSVEAGDPLGVAAGILTIAAAAASQSPGLTSNASVLGLSTATALAIAATGTAVIDALVRGDVATALITSLGPLLTAIAANVSNERDVAQLEAANHRGQTLFPSVYDFGNSIFIPYSPANESFATQTEAVLDSIGNTIATAASELFDFVFETRAPGVPTEDDIFVPPKNWDGQKVPASGGRGYGYPDVDGNVWVPTGTGNAAHGGPHWDVQKPGGGHINVYPGGKIR